MEGVTRGSSKPPRIVIYAPPKWGKSTAGSEAPSPIFLTTEDGVDNLPVDQFGPEKNWTEFTRDLRRIATEDHSYKTVVIDTLNGCAELAANHVCETQFKNNWGPGGFLSFGQGWSATSELMRELLPLLDQCRARGMICLLLAHSGLQNVKTPSDGDYSKFAPDLDKKVWARFAKWSDIIIRGDYEHTIIEPKNGRVKIESTEIRIAHCAGSMSQDAGTRVGFELPEQFIFSWNKFQELLGQKDNLLEQVRELWPLLSDADQKKTLLWLGCDLEKAPSHKMNQLLNRLKEKKS